MIKMQKFQSLSSFFRPIWMGFLQIAHRLMIPLMFLVISYALVVSLFSALTPWVRSYKPQITAIINQTAHQKIEIEDITTSWYGWYPVLKLYHVSLMPEDGGKSLVCDECWIGFDVIRSLLYWHLHPGMLYIDGLDLQLIQKSDHWEIQGAKNLSNNQQVKTDPVLVLGKLLSYAPERVLLKNIQLAFHPLSKKMYAFEHIRLLGVKNAGQYHWSIQSSFGKKSLLKVRIDMPLLSNLALPENGRMFVEFENLDLTALPGYQQWIEEKSISRLKGILNSSAWVDWNQGNINEIHAQVAVEHGLIQTKVSNSAFHFDKFDANCLWKKRSTGWEMAMDKVNLKSSALSLVEDKLLLFYQSDWNSYHVYLKYFPLKILSMVKSQMSLKFFDMFPFMPKGDLRESQLNFKEGVLDYVLTQFENCSWGASDKFPGVSGLSGVLSWEPRSAHFEIASQNFVLKPKDQKPIVFDNLQCTATTEKNVLDEWQLYLEKLVLARRDLALTMTGQIQQPLEPQKRNVLMQMNWSAEGPQVWLPYLKLVLPDTGLRRWLTQDVKRIHQTSGNIIINGLWKDFPFDAQQGEFTVNAHLYDVDLSFAKSWPLATHVDANLKSNGRHMEVMIDKAILGDLPVSQLHLNFPQLGLGKEVILVHGVIQDKVSKMMQYLMKSPLRHKAKNWMIYDFQGNGILDLKLDIPLSKERDEVFVDGQLKISEQPLDLKIFTHPLRIENCQGQLHFNGNGLYAGTLKGRVGGDLFTMDVKNHPVEQDTELFIYGVMGLDVLKKAWGMESSNLISGHIPVEGRIRLPYEKGKNWEMDWTSHLKGVVLALPKPWNKKAEEEKPFKIEMILHENGLMNMEVFYQQKEWKLDYEKQVWHLKIAEPEGLGDIFYHTAQKKIEAKFSHLYLDDTLFQNTDTKHSPDWSINDMPSVNIQVEDFHLNDLNLGSLLLNAQTKDKKFMIEELKISSPYYTLLMHGDWSMSQMKHHIQFVGQMMISNLSKLLIQWGMTPVANTKNGVIEFNGSWSKALNKVSLKTLKGAIDVRFKKGNISHFDKQTEQKIGLGKLLSILSLQTLPRRLQLDFSDLATSGFPYDIFKGRFELNQGLLHTADSQMDGPIAHVKMNGDLNILDKWYDLELQVYPYITASLPVVATIAGGPIAGVATWAANHVINKGMQQVSGYTYKITGPWKEPIVQQVNLMRKKNDAPVKTND